MPISFSCIIPTCDRPKLLAEAVASVLDQSRTPDEVIIVDAGKHVVSLPPDISRQVKIFRIAPNSGASLARNYGAGKSAGDYLAFLDDDDLWNKEYLNNVEEAVRQGANCVLSSIDIFKDGKWQFRKDPDGKLTLSNLLISNPGAGGSNLVISKKLFVQLRGFDPSLAASEDKSLIIELIRRGETVKILSDNPIFARRFGGTESLSNPKTMAEGVYNFTRKYVHLMNFRQKFHNWYKIYFYRYKSGRKSAILPYALFYLIHKLFSA